MLALRTKSKRFFILDSTEDSLEFEEERYSREASSITDYKKTDSIIHR